MTVKRLVEVAVAVFGVAALIAAVVYLIAGWTLTGTVLVDL